LYALEIIVRRFARLEEGLLIDSLAIASWMM